MVYQDLILAGGIDVRHAEVKDKDCSLDNGVFDLANSLANLSQKEGKVVRKVIRGLGEWLDA